MSTTMRGTARTAKQLISTIASLVVRLEGAPPARTCSELFGRSGLRAALFCFRALVSGKAGVKCPTEGFATRTAEQGTPNPRIHAVKLLSSKPISGARRHG